MLTNLQIRGFKSIRSLDALALGPLNVLIGPNGSGKSNLISFFRMLRQMTEPRGFPLWVGRSGGASKLLHDGPAMTPQIEASVRFHAGGDSQSELEYRFLVVHAAADTLVFGNEIIQRGDQRVLLTLDVGRSQSLMLIASDDRQTEQLTQLLRATIADCAIYQLHNTSDTSRIRQRWNTSDGRFLKEDAANLGAFLYRLKTTRPEAYARIASTLRQIAPFFSDFELEPEGGSILLGWREAGSDVLFTADQASDGTLRVMALVALLLQPEDELPQVILLDEPELGLHPFAIGVIAGLLRSVSVHSQIIVATQSAALVDEFQPEEIIVVDRPHRESTFRRLDPEKLREWLEEYSLSELWDKNVLGGRPA